MTVEVGASPVSVDEQGQGRTKKLCDRTHGRVYKTSWRSPSAQGLWPLEGLGL